MLVPAAPVQHIVEGTSGCNAKPGDVQTSCATVDSTAAMHMEEVDFASFNITCRKYQAAALVQ
jgi:hypothetical protein